MKKILISFCFVLGLSSVAFSQGAIDGYMKGKGNLDLALSYAKEDSDKYFSRNSGGDTTLNFGIETQSVNLFAAYGISDRFDIIASIPYVQRTSSAKGLQDAGVYLKYKIVHSEIEGAGRLKFILGAGAQFPISDYDFNDARAIGQQAFIIPVRGVLQLDLNNGFFGNITGGYNFRLDENDRIVTDANGEVIPTTQPDNFTTLSAKIGYASAKHYADIWFDFQNTEGGNSYRDGDPSGFKSFGVSYTKIGGTYYYAIRPQFGAFVGLSKIFSGRNIGNSFTYNLGVVYKFNFNK